jgi:hypothetical protein
MVHQNENTENESHNEKKQRSELLGPQERDQEIDEQEQCHYNSNPNHVCLSNLVACGNECQ